MLHKSVNTSNETSLDTTPKAPPDFTEILTAFSTENKKSSILAAWMTAVLPMSANLNLFNFPLNIDFAEFADWLDADGIHRGAQG